MQDWLALHGMEAAAVIQWCRTARDWPAPTAPTGPPLGALDLAAALRTQVLPAFTALLGPPAGSLDAIRIVRSAHNCTVRDTETGQPVVRLVWTGDAASLLVLAHEIAHAGQMLLSAGCGLMPPVAREVCAITGEMALLDHARATDEALGAALSSAWAHDTRKRLAGAERLAAALASPKTSRYAYDHNYPLACAAAWARRNLPSAAQAALFASGAAAMTHLALPPPPGDTQ